MSILEAKEVSKTYIIDGREATVLDRASLGAGRGEFVVVKGESGSGKTTLLSILSGLDKPTSGRVILDGEDITDLGEDRMAPIRNASIGFVFQSFHLAPALTAMENVMFPAELRRDPDARAKAESLLERVGLKSRSGSFPHQLSGGEKQRVAICRALVNAPKIVFADEPTGNLDSTNGAAVLDLLLELRKEHGATLILVTHNDEIARMGDRIVHIRDGRIVSDEAGGAR